MERTSRLRKALVAVAISAMMFAGGANATSWSTDVTDIWWNPNEAGWGVNMIQTGNLVFVTFYVYNADRKPTWFGGTLSASSATPNTYSGDLYVTTGPYYGVPFNPNDVFVRVAGAATFTLDTVTAGTLQYVVDGMRVTKLIQRQPISYDYYGGEYLVSYTYTNTGCKAASQNGIYSGSGRVVIAQNQATMTMEIQNVLAAGTCKSSGRYDQLGRMGTYTAPYSCAWGETGSMQIYEMNNSPYVFTARMSFSSPGYGCNTRGEIVGVIPR